MKFYFLDNHEKADKLLTLNLPIMPREACFVHFDETIPLETQHRVLSHVMRKTAVVIRSCALESFSNKFDTSYAKGILLQVRPSKSPQATDREVPFSCRDKIFEQLANISSALTQSNKNLYLEILVNKENIRSLFSFLMGLAQINIEQIFLNPVDLTLDHTDLFHSQFENLKIYGKNLPTILFSPHHPQATQWECATLNEFAGPSVCEIDLSNICNQNCLFCGLHSTTKESVSRSKELEQLAMETLPTSAAIDLLNSLPDKDIKIILGGAGEPTLHKDFLTIIRTARERGFSVEIFSNISRISSRAIEELHSLSAGAPGEITFIANVSAATPETFFKIKGNPRPDDFKTTINNIKSFYALRLRDGYGVSVHFLAIITKLNCHELGKMTLLAKEIGATFFYPKPMQIHGDSMRDLLVDTNDDFNKDFYKMLYLADLVKIPLSLPKQYEEHRDKLLRSSDIKGQVASQALIECYQTLQEIAEFAKSPELANYQIKLMSHLKDRKILAEYQISSSAEKSYLEKIETLSCSPMEYYSKRPCYVGFISCRLLVNQRFQTCCLSTYQDQEEGHQTWKKFWQGRYAQNMRSKLLKISDEQFHKCDPEWSFCKQCSYVQYNETFHHLKNGGALDDQTYHPF